jgi:hypothetical protein
MVVTRSLTESWCGVYSVCGADKFIQSKRREYMDPSSRKNKTKVGGHLESL